MVGVAGILPIGESNGKKSMFEFCSIKHKGSNCEWTNTAKIALLFLFALSQTRKYCLPFILELSMILNLEGYFLHASFVFAPELEYRPRNGAIPPEHC